MFLSKPTYYLWKAEFDSQQKFENVKTSLIDSGFRVVVYIDGKTDNDINTASLQILEDTDNSLKPYKVLKTPEEITVLINNFLPDLPATITASELSDQYLHCSVCDRWHAGNGI